MAQTPHFHCRGPRLGPWSGELRCHKPHSTARKKRYALPDSLRNAHHALTRQRNHLLKQEEVARSRMMVEELKLRQEVPLFLKKQCFFLGLALFYPLKFFTNKKDPIKIKWGNILCASSKKIRGWGETTMLKPYWLSDKKESPRPKSWWF